VTLRLFGGSVTVSPQTSLIWIVASTLVLALVCTPLPTLLLALGALLTIVLPLIHPVFGLYLVVLSIPVQEVVHAPGGLSFTQAATLLALGGWLLRVLAHPERPITKHWLLPLWLTMLAALLLSTSFTPYSRNEALKESLRWIVAFVVWLITINTVRRPWQIAGLVACLLLAPASNALLGLIQFATGDGPPSFRISADSPFVRAYGTIGAPNSFAGYLNMAWPLALALTVGGLIGLWRATNRAERWRAAAVVLGAGSCCALLLGGLLASFSRGGWLGAMCGLLALVLALGRPFNRWATVAVVCGLVVVLMSGGGLLPAPLANRIASITRSLTLFDASTVEVTDENFAQVERMAQLQAGWRMFRAHPLVGVGPGNYNAAYPDVAVFPWYASRGHAHNYYIHLAGELGVFGLAAYGALLGGVVLCVYAAIRRAIPLFLHSTAVGCCGIIATMVGHELFENLHALSMGIHLAAVWGLVIVLSHYHRPAARTASSIP
jgi:O-antigen ligase